MSEIKYYQLKYVPTGIVFKIPQAEAVEIFKEDRGNYEILDKDFVDDVKKEEVTTVSQQVVENETENNIPDECKNCYADGKTPAQEDCANCEHNKEAEKDEFVKQLEAMKVAELKEYCNKNKISFDKNDRKDALIEKILEFEKNAEVEVAEQVIEG